MKALNNAQLAQVTGGDFDLGYEVGNAIGSGIRLLNSFGRGLGSGLYDALHKSH